MTAADYTARFIRDAQHSLTPAQVATLTGADVTAWGPHGSMAIIDTHSTIYGSHGATVTVYRPGDTGPGACRYVNADSASERDTKIADALTCLVPIVAKWDGGEWLVEACDWDSNGCHTVTLRSASGRVAIDDNTIRRARRRAYRCDSMGKSKRSLMTAHDGHRITFKIYR